MGEEIKEILDKLNKTADNHLFVICSSQKELDEIPKYTSNFLSVNDRQAKLLLNYITNLQRKVEQLENIRKETIEYMKEFIFEPLLINEDRKLIMFNENIKNNESILNKEYKNIK